MKIIQVNTVIGKGSTGRICVDIATALDPYGVETCIAYGYGEPVYKHCYHIGSFVEDKLHNLFSRLVGLQGLGSRCATRRFLNFLDKYKPDIIHLNNLHGNYINYPILLRYIARKGIPIVWTMHDCWPYTGKCAHYVNAGCEKWKTKCGHCPNLHTYPPSLFVDNSSKSYDIKKRLYDRLCNVTMVGVSDWMKREAEQSILSKFTITRIYNWIDCDVFKPSVKDGQLMQKYGISQNKFLVLGVCGRYSKAKGSESWRYLSEKLPDDCQIVLVGNMEAGNEIKNVINIPYVESPNTLALIYSICDVFCNMSEAESFGKTTAEALACGTPIIVYDTTACPELVGDGCGFVCAPNNWEEVKEKILLVKEQGKVRFSQNCINFARRNFSRRNILQFMDLYNKILAKQ